MTNTNNEPESSPLPKKLLPTPKQERVLRAIFLGHSQKRIAREMIIAEATVASHARNLRGKWGVVSNEQLIATAMCLGLIKPEWVEALSKEQEVYYDDYRSLIIFKMQELMICCRNIAHPLLFALMLSTAFRENESAEPLQSDAYDIGSYPFLSHTPKSYQITN